jgi:membrane protein
VYNFAPNLARRHRVWFTPGACVGVALWLAASYGLRLYLAEFGVTSRTYGSLGAVIVLLMWFYLTAMAILVGGEVNSEISLAALGHRDRADRSRR